MVAAEKMNAKSAENTVFVRFHPPSSLLRRHHIEHHFSQVGPIKKASLIIPKKSQEEDTTKPSSYGFIKYTCLSDARVAAQQLNRSTLTLPAVEQKEGEPSVFQVKVELASEQVKKQNKSEEDEKGAGEKHEKESSVLPVVSKKHSRVIIRNLSFYAKESHIQQAMKEFGPLVEVHIPKVESKSRGFAFCTFQNPRDAQNAINSCHAKPMQIKNRNVQVEFSIPKAVHQVQKEKDEKLKRKEAYQKKVKEEVKAKQEEREKEDNEDSSDEDEDEDEDGEGSSGSDSDSDGSDDSSGAGEKEEESVKEGADENKEQKVDPQQAIEEQRELFVRNLPFDATRHDVFETFRKFGKIEAIYLVSDPKTGLPRGTGFVTYETHAAAARAVKEGTNKTLAQSKAEGVPLDGGIVMKSRSLLVDYAVDRETANTLKSDSADGAGSRHHKDKRYLYLKGEGRVDDESAWASLGERDQTKRQSAWAEKTAKLKSPLFFINPHRLSIRNISKSVDEPALKQLLFNATRKGLEKGLVSIKDQEALWRAAGEMSAREILERCKALKAGAEVENPLKTAMLDEKNIRKTLPSVYLDRDFAAVPQGKNKSLAPSRGFAFAEFEHHVQALACLRELNNNPAYSESFAAGGKAAASAISAAKKRRHKKKRKDEDGDEPVKISRLIVEFTVENNAKAKQQAERRTQQQTNRQKQKLETRQKKMFATSSKDNNDKKNLKKRSRGAKQREKKRQRRLEGEDGQPMSALEAAEAKGRDFQEAGATKKRQVDEKSRGVKPSKKPKKEEREEMELEAKFTKLVDRYKIAFVDAGAKDAAATAIASEQKKEVLDAEGKRWFE